MKNIFVLPVFQSPFPPSTVLQILSQDFLTLSWKKKQNFLNQFSYRGHFTGFGSLTYFLTTLQKNPVPTEELLKGVTHGVASFPDAYGLHHARVAQLTHAEISVEELKDKTFSGHSIKGFF